MLRYKLVLVLAAFVICFSAAVPVRSQDPKLAELRADFARRYLQPDAHFALAKYYLDRGDFLQAFFIIEYARRYRFEEKDFDKAFVAFFGDPMPEPPDEAKAAFAAGNKLVTEANYDEAEVYFQKAHASYGKSFFINAWIGRFYYKTKADSSRALPYYFQSYFLYPHAYETEYVESRIRTISISNARGSLKSLLNNGQPLTELLRQQNPLVVSMAIEEISKDWKPEYVVAVREAMDNDESLVRWQAFATLLKFAGPSRERIVDELLTDRDPRKRGLAAYAIADRPGPGKFQILKKMLTEQAELVRFDAVSALAMKGGEKGRRILEEHKLVEKQPMLRELIVHALSGSKKQPS